MFKTRIIMKDRGRQGFTLIELLIVVAVIGILAAIAIPAFTQYKVKSLNAVAQTDLRSLRTDLESFFADNFNYPY